MAFKDKNYDFLTGVPTVRRFLQHLLFSTLGTQASFALVARNILLEKTQDEATVTRPVFIQPLPGLNLPSDLLPCIGRPS